MNTKEILTLGLTKAENTEVLKRIVPMINQAFADEEDVDHTISKVYSIIHNFRPLNFTRVSVNCFMTSYPKGHFKILLQRIS